MRTNLIMHFHCSECGGQLRLQQEGERIKARPESPACGDDDPPVSVPWYCTSSIRIQPCKRCIEEYTGPGKKVTSSQMVKSDLESDGQK